MVTEQVVMFHRRPAQRVQAKQCLVQKQIAEQKRGDAPAFAVVGKAVQYGSNTSREQKLGKTVHHPGSSRKNAVCLPTLQCGQNGISVLREQHPLSSLDIYTHTDYLDIRPKCTFV
ncbi:MAG: hypothetical protein HYX78_01245 [Armatimonadetes bacterium]|nr:hypothetical protein [Armatimonadota bacterium]